MGVKFNFIKIESNIFSVTYEFTKKTFWTVFLEPLWVFASVTAITLLANEETFPLHNLLRLIKNFFEGSLKFALKLNIVIVLLFGLMALLMTLELIHRLIRNRDDCHGFSYMPIYFLIQLGNYDPEDRLFWIFVQVFEWYFYISALYTNYLIMAVPDFSNLFLLYDSNRWMGVALGASLSLLLTGVFINTIKAIGRSFGISSS